MKMVCLDFFAHVTHIIFCRLCLCSLLLLQPYFFVQDPDYITVKERVANYCANGFDAVGVADIDIAVETLRVAEYLTPTMQKELL